MRDFCLGCFIRHHLKQEGLETERYLEQCPHSGELYLVLYGPAPKTRKDVERIARVLRTQFKITNPRGRKSKPKTLEDIIRAFEKISPRDHLDQFANALGVSPRSAQVLVKKLTGETFREIQVQRMKNNKSRLRFPRRRRPKTRRNKST